MTQSQQHYVIFDLNGMVAFFDKATNSKEALEALITEDESYGHNPPRVHKLNMEETKLMQRWIDGGQKTNEWPFDWRMER